MLILAAGFIDLGEPAEVGGRLLQEREEGGLIELAFRVVNTIRF